MPRHQQPGPWNAVTEWNRAYLLLTNTEPFNDGPISRNILILEIVQQATTLSDHPQQSAARMMVFCMHLKMIGQIRDLFAQNRDLDFRRPRIGIVSSIGIYDFGLSFCCK